jgi:S-adenosylmethionine hydrolase
MSLITLMTDFGIKDGNVGVMKGVIWSLAPEAQIADLSHTISPQNVREAALILARSAPYFPPGTIHLVVVDPGVGTERRPLAARIGQQYFIGPDNGLITLLLDQAEEAEFIHLDRPGYWLPELSSVFHGRDIFAPCAAHLARGVPLSELGTPISDPVLLDFPQPQPIPSGLRGEIIHIDHFGNLSTNIRREHLQGRLDLTVRYGAAEVRGLVRTFGERPPGELVSLYGSTGNLLLCVVNGSAAQRLDAALGDTVEVTFQNPDTGA